MYKSLTILTIPKHLKEAGLAILLTTLCLSCSSTNDSASDSDILASVDPMIGTGFHGHTFPGAVVPFGRVQLSPDTKLNGWDASSGYHYGDSSLYGFSHTHLSGTGIGDMGDVLFLPYTGKRQIGNQEPMKAAFQHKSEKAQVGYYSVLLDESQIFCELTATQRVGFHRYTYPTTQEAKLKIDLAHTLQQTWGHSVKMGRIEQLDAKTIVGYRLSSGWAKHDPIYFKATFNQPILSMGTEVSEKMKQGEKSESENGSSASTSAAEGQQVIAYLDFGKLTQPLTIQVGISSVDQAGAEGNLAEVQHFASFDEVVRANQELWRASLQSIRIKTKDAAVRTNFYTALYHAQIAPMISSDADGRYLGMDHKIHSNTEQNAYTVFSLWDTFRAWYPLMTILDREKSAEWIYSLYFKYVNGGMLPKWGLNSNYTGTMVGYPAVSLFADALSKDVINKDLDKFLEACVTAATWQPEWLKSSGFPNAGNVMTEHIKHKEQRGTVPSDKIHSAVSYGLEMAYYDFCVAVVAAKAGRPEVAEEFLKKAQYYQHYYDASTGFMRGKNADNSWRSPFNPRHSDHAHSDYVEGNAYQWTPFVPHDPEGFAELLGGKEQLGNWLDSLFMTSSEIVGENASGDITGLIGQYAHGNEPSHHIAYLYHFSDRPWRCAEVVDQILYEFYKPTPEGIVGNEDCGQMSAWYVLNALGFYQIAPGKPVFHIGRPLVDEAEIQVAGGSFKISVLHNSRQNKYVKSAQIDGVALKGLQFSYAQIKAGSELVITMGEK